MITLLIVVPAIAALVLALATRMPARAVSAVWIAASAVEMLIAIGATAVFAIVDRSGPLGLEERVAWIPGAGSSYHVGVDGFSLPLILLTVVIFVICSIAGAREPQRRRALAALFLFLESTCVGIFAAQDLILFFLFFDLSIVGMYFAIAGWGHNQARRSALKFFLYTFIGSLVLLLGFIGLYLASDPHTFDIAELAQNGISTSPLLGGLILLALFVGLAIKIPTFPFHSWLPPAHTDAPTIGSVVLASVMLKMGTYGLVRIVMPILPDSWTQWGWLIATIGVISVLYGALVALAQTDLKRMIAFTSINHMGYVVLAVGAAGVIGQSTGGDARQLAITGAVTQMVSHGLITGALFLLAGVMYDRRGTYDLGAFGGLATSAPRYAALFGVASFASLGLPGFSSFIAEFQIFAGSIGLWGWAALALPGIVITAALLLRAFQKVFTGDEAGLSAGFADVDRREFWTSASLLGLAVIVGLVPAPLLALIAPASNHLAAILLP